MRASGRVALVVLALVVAVPVVVLLVAGFGQLTTGWFLAAVGGFFMVESIMLTTIFWRWLTSRAG